MTLRFGTDGVRGVANVELTAEYVLDLGRAAAEVLGADPSTTRPLVVLGRDTRASSPMLSAALAAGIASAGADVVDAGVVPTAAVALLTRELGACAGAVVSASHNPAADNGVKFFGPGGQKLSDDVEAELEDHVAGARTEPGARPSGAGVGSISADPTLAGRYLELLLDAATPLAGLSVVVDSANGAASDLGPELLRRAGASVVAINAAPDGSNINAGCGATEPDALAAAVRANGADLGLAFDGDADRLVAADEHGEIIDGDRVLAVCALDLRDRGLLRNDAIVATVMSNLGLHRLLAEHGIGVVTSPVGDRNVLIALEANDLVLGGEQSGHVIFRDIAPTGCGLLTAVELAGVVVRTGTPLSALAASMESVPQRLHNVTLTDSSVLDRADALWEVVAAVESGIGHDGQVLVRPSGTEPKLRIMVQASDQKTVDDAVDRIAAAAVALR